MAEQTPKYKFLSKYLKENPESASQVISESNVEQLSELFHQISAEDLAPSLNLVPSSILSASLLELDDELCQSILSKLSANVAAGVLRHWGPQSKAKTESVLQKLDQKLSKAIKTLLIFDEGSVGSLMNPIPMSALPHATTKEVLSLLQKKKSHYNRYVYVVDDENALQGVLPFKELFYSDPDALVSSKMTSNIFSFKPDIGMNQAFEHSCWKRWDSVPVTDNKKQLLGIISYDSLEAHLANTSPPKSEGDEIYKAGAAVGEVFQIGITATMSAFGLDKRR